MSLVNTGEMLRAASRAGYCVGAFNVVDYYTIAAAIGAAESCSAPVIIQTSPAVIRRYGPETLVYMAHALASASPVPVGLHLDHGTDPEMIQACIAAGYTSVMIDASHFPFEENIARTSAVVQAAHACGVAVEAEIGVMAGVEDDLVVHQDAAIYTTPEEAITFQARTQVDFLAAAIGTAHGFYKVAPRLDINTLRAIHAQVDFPLVIHGGTGLAPEVVCELVASGAAKFNVSTQLKKTYIEGLAAHLAAHPGKYDPLALLDAARQAVLSVIAGYIRLLGGEGRAA